MDHSLFHFLEAGLADRADNVAQTRRLVQRSMKTVHRFATALHPAVLDDLRELVIERRGADERIALARRDTADGVFWQLVPAQSGGSRRIP